MKQLIIAALLFLPACEDTIVSPASLRTRMQDEKCERECAEKGWAFDYAKHDDSVTCYCKERQSFPESEEVHVCYQYDRPANGAWSSKEIECLKPGMKGIPVCWKDSIGLIQCSSEWSAKWSHGNK